MNWSTQEQAASALGVGEVTIWRAINGKRPAGERFIAALLTAAAVHDRTFDDLFEVTTTGCAEAA
jgi:transcriptional regulator with XRE-family HTH domain